MNTIKIGIADDHPFIVEGIRVVLSLSENLRLAWSAFSEEEAIRQLSEDPVDVLIVDLKMSNSKGGFAVLEQAMKRVPAPRVIILSAYAPAHLVRESALRGASAYFTKADGGNGLVEAIQVLGKGPAPVFLGPFKELAKPSIFLDLSSREREVLLHIAQGKSNSQIADSLGLKVGTVKTHLENIYKKLGASNRTDALRSALSEGYFSIDDIR